MAQARRSVAADHPIAEMTHQAGGGIERVAELYDDLI